MLTGTGRGLAGDVHVIRIGAVDPPNLTDSARAAGGRQAVVSLSLSIDGSGPTG
jgi:hypothetical protein